MRFFIIILFFFASFARLDAGKAGEIEALARDADALSKGEVVYKQMCFACHGMNLEGAAGPNLVDATWIHGKSPADWYRVITEGASEKGMMAYEAVYDDETRKALAAYIFSQQEGLREFRYEVYPPVEEEAELRSFGSGDPIKSGEIPDALVDLSPVEIDDYNIVFRGKFLVPREGKYLFIGNFRDCRVRLLINGEPNKIPTNRFRRPIVLPAGEHDVEVAYQRVSATPRFLLLDVRTPAGIKIPLSRDSHQILKSSSYLYKVTEQPIVVRTVQEGVPNESLAVGLPGGVSFSMGRNGSVYSVWDGVFLDTGPNVSERGKRPAKTGSPWFIGQGGIRLLLSDGKPLPLRLREYRWEGSRVIFEFAAENETVTIEGKCEPGILELHFLTKGIEGNVVIEVPAGVNLEPGQLATTETREVSIDDPASFSITIHKPRL